jgi:hypothetical protein
MSEKTGSTRLPVDRYHVREPPAHHMPAPGLCRSDSRRIAAISDRPGGWEPQHRVDPPAHGKSSPRTVHVREREKRPRRDRGSYHRTSYAMALPNGHVKGKLLAADLVAPRARRSDEKLPNSPRCGRPRPPAGTRDEARATGASASRSPSAIPATEGHLVGSRKAGATYFVTARRGTMTGRQGLNPAATRIPPAPRGGPI